MICVCIFCDSVKLFDVALWRKNFFYFLFLSEIQFLFTHVHLGDSAMKKPMNCHAQSKAKHSPSPDTGSLQIPTWSEEKKRKKKIFTHREKKRKITSVCNYPPIGLFCISFLNHSAALSTISNTKIHINNLYFTYNPPHLYIIMFSILSRPSIRSKALNIRFKSTHTKSQVYKTPLLTWVTADLKNITKIFFGTSAFMGVIFGWPYMYKYYMTGKGVHEFDII